MFSRCLYFNNVLLLGAGGLLVFVLSVGYYITHIQARLRAVRNMEGESLSIIHEAGSMMRVIVAFGIERHEHRKFR